MIAFVLKVLCYIPLGIGLCTLYSLIELMYKNRHKKKEPDCIDYNNGDDDYENCE